MKVAPDYTGWRRWAPTAQEWADFYLNGKVPFEMVENEYLIISQDGEAPTYYCWENGGFRQFRGGSIKTYGEAVEEEQGVDDAPKKKRSKGYSKSRQTAICPRNDEQACAFDLVKDDSKTVKLLLGVWGSGKDFIMANAALEALNSGKVEQIV